MDIVYNPTTITQVQEFLRAPLTNQNAVHQLKQDLQTQTTAELKNRIGGILEGEKVGVARGEWLDQEGEGGRVWVGGGGGGGGGGRKGGGGEGRRAGGRQGGGKEEARVGYCCCPTP